MAITRAIVAPPRDPSQPKGIKLTLRLPPPDPRTGATDAQVYATLGVMRGLVRDAQRWPAVQRLASSPATVYNICARVTFKRDPRHAEALRHPEIMARQLEQGYPCLGDCDDRATLGAALILARQRYPVFIVMSRRRGAPFEHVYFGECFASAAHGVPSNEPICPYDVIPFDPQERTPPGQWTPPGLDGGRLECWAAW